MNRVLGGLGVGEKALASRAFDHLITRRGTKMAYTEADLAEAVRAGERALGKTLDRLAEAKILRGQSRRGVLWYELHHDLFSRIVERWNREYKARQRRRKGSLGSAQTVAPLIEKLADSSGAVRSSAAWALGIFWIALGLSSGDGSCPG